MDADHELWRFKFAFVAFVVFIVSFFASCSELKYFTHGKTAEAHLGRAAVVTSRGRFGTRRQKLQIDYVFQDGDGSTRRESDTVATSWPVPEGDTIPVQYIPGSPGDSRLEGHSQAVFVYIFFASLAWLAFLGFRFWKFYKS
ncbi:MAG: hypothetical protein KF745_05745 [Phycisphaeraceae bacterium]|nr:hypothetical protein [Phycisphaeraceae bacterium]